MNVKGHRFWNESMICERRDFKLGVNKVNYFEICLDSEGFGPKMGACPDMGEFGTGWIGTFGIRPVELGRFWRLKGLPENVFCGLARLGDIFWAELGRLDTENLKFFSTGFWTWVGHFGATVGVDGVLKFSFIIHNKFQILNLWSETENQHLLRIEIFIPWWLWSGGSFNGFNASVRSPILNLARFIRRERSVNTRTTTFSNVIWRLIENENSQNRNVYFKTKIGSLKKCVNVTAGSRKIGLKNERCKTMSIKDESMRLN